MIGLCTCGNCQFCGYRYPVWAPPVYVYTNTTNKFEFDFNLNQHQQIQRFLKRISLPMYKLHADGSCTKLMDGLGSLGISFNG